MTTAIGIIILIAIFAFVLLISFKEWKDALFFVLFYSACAVLAIILVEITEYYKAPPKDLSVMKTTAGFLYNSSVYRCSGNNEYYTVLMKDTLSKPTRRDLCVWCNQNFGRPTREYTKELEEMDNAFIDAILNTPCE